MSLASQCISIVAMVTTMFMFELRKRYRGRYDLGDMAIEATPSAQRAGIAIVSSLSTSKPAVYSQRITNNSAKKRTDTPPSHKNGSISRSISSHTSLTALQETREESLPHSPPLSPSLYIQQELASLSADQISSTHSHTFVPDAEILVSHSSDLHTHVLSQTLSDPHTSCPRSHTSDLHSHSDPQLNNGIQENTCTDETHSRSNKSHSYTDETHSHIDEPGKLFMYKNDNLIFISVIPQVNSLPAQFDKEQSETEGETKDSISKHSSIHVSYCIDTNH